MAKQSRLVNHTDLYTLREHSVDWMVKIYYVMERWKRAFQVKFDVLPSW